MVWRHFCFLLVWSLGSQRLRHRKGGEGGGLRTGKQEAGLSPWKRLETALTTARVPGWLLGGDR